MTDLLYLSVLGNLQSAGASGVLRKLSGQAKALNDLGLISRLHIVTFSEIHENTILPDFASYEIIQERNLILRRKLVFESFYRAFSSEKPNLLYMRYPLSDITFLSFLKDVRDTRTLLFTEHQAIEPKELISHKNAKAVVKYANEVLFRKKVSKYLDLRVCVTDEIGEYYKRVSPSVPVLIVPNGIEVDSIPLRENYAPANRITLGFVGNLSPWNGLDSLISHLAALGFEYRGFPIRLIIIGDGIFYGNLEKQIRSLGVADNVILTGYLKDPRFDFLSQCDIGIGSLAPSRRGVTEGSNLKLREYCAFGLPFVKLDKDMDFDVGKAQEFSLTLDSLNELSIRTMLEFAIKCKSKNNIASLMRGYAENTIDWKAKMMKVISTYRCLS